MDDEDECVDVGNAYLDLQELLLTGNDVIEQQIDSRCYTWIFICLFVFFSGLYVIENSLFFSRKFHNINLD